MAEYAGVRFHIYAPGSIWQPTWERESAVSSEMVPGGDFSVTQYMGSSNYRWRGTILVLSADDLATLEAAKGATTRILSDFQGGTFGTVALLSMRNIRRTKNALNDGEVRYLVDVEFERI